MKKIISKVFSLLLITMIALSIPPMTLLADENAMNITIRIEGVDSNLFYETQEIPCDGELTVQDVLAFINEQSSSIKITGVENAFISDINGESSEKFGGWDGWMYIVNGVQPIGGIDGYELSDGDVVVIYYGDPFGVGMQYPVADISKIQDGIVRFTSEDTTYDDDYNANVSINPVVGATITWSCGELSAEYITDENGEIRIDSSQLDKGGHIIQISKIHETGIPLVLRFAPDFSVNVDSVSVDEVNLKEFVSNNGDESEVTSLAEEIIEATLEETETIVGEDKANPQTGMNSSSRIEPYIFVFILILILCFGAAIIEKKYIHM